MKGKEPAFINPILFDTQNNSGKVWKWTHQQYFITEKVVIIFLFL